jgi:hypothetical protein
MRTPILSTIKAIMITDNIGNSRADLLEVKSCMCYTVKIDFYGH